MQITRGRSAFNSIVSQPSNCALGRSNSGDDLVQLEKPISPDGLFNVPDDFLAGESTFADAVVSACQRDER
jgi:hypothetical protein